MILGSFAFGAGADYSIFDIKKNLPLRDHEKVYRDYYVNMGSDQGVKVGSIIAVYRRMGVIDKSRNELHEDMLIPVAHLKVIQASQTVSVARLESMVSHKAVPVVDVGAVGLGDRVELVDDEVREVSSVTK
jgi:hypothetical protein